VRNDLSRLKMANMFEEHFQAEFELLKFLAVM